MSTHAESDKIVVTNSYSLILASPVQGQELFFQLLMRIQGSLLHGSINVLNGNFHLMSSLKHKD